jgi:redox-sensitive bicupin YhaK (pirin superfamily)
MLDDEAGYVRVIAGKYQEHIGPAKVHSLLHVYDVFIKQGHTIQLPAKSGDTTLLYMRSGRANLPLDQDSNDDTSHDEWDDHGLAVMSNLQENVEVTAQRDSHILYLSGTPFHEPINGHGPFVMNTYDEILEAFDDIKTGNFIRYKAIDTE